MHTICYLVKTTHPYKTSWMITRSSGDASTQVSIEAVDENYNEILDVMANIPVTYSLEDVIALDALNIKGSTRKLHIELNTQDLPKLSNLGDIQGVYVYGVGGGKDLLTINIRDAVVHTDPKNTEVHNVFNLSADLVSTIQVLFPNHRLRAYVVLEK